MKDPDKELLAELLIQWEERYLRGQESPAAEVAKDHPELIAELERRIKVLKKVAWLDKPLDDDPPGQDPPNPSSPSQRTIAGRYRLDELIAEGGFAQVFRAYDKELQRTVAVKVPKPSRLESNDAFLAEARRAARLKHDGIVPVHDVGTDGDTVFIVSEYLEGGSLADRLTQGKIDQDDAVRWVTEIADALEYAHLNGVIHRDIKPANIVIDHHGRAKLTDFGIAHSATKTGSFAPSLGTLRYMAPEQLQGTSADHRSDIYSLAVVLYEALTGRVPYSSFEPNVLRREIVHGRPAALEGLPHHLRSICEKALSKSPHQRHSSAAQFAAELRKATPMNRWKWTTIAALIVAVGAGAAGVAALRNGRTPSARTPKAETATAADITTDKKALAPVTQAAPRRQERLLIPLPPRERTIVTPETVGVEKDCPFPTVTDAITFECPTCGLKMRTHVLYPHLPHCSKDGSVMLELPAATERLHWQGDKGIAFLYDEQRKQWREQTNDEPPSCLFDEVAHTPLYVEIFDPQRRVTIRIYDSHATYREDDGQPVLLRVGKWVSKSQ